MAAVFLGLGSNVDRRHNIRSALEALERRFGTLQCSPVYESEAVGFNGSPFFNLVVAIETTLTVRELVDTLHDMEHQHGRVRGEKRLSSRTLDIDVLTYDQACGNVEGVTLPRSEILKHAFVLWPLADLAPRAIHPVCGKSYGALRRELTFPDQKLWQITL